MNASQLDYLDALAERVRTGDEHGIGALSCGEFIYVALAANRPDLLPHDTVVEAIARLGAADTAELVRRWQYRG